MIGSSMIDRKAEGEVEVTVIKRAIPSDADLVPAHQTGQRIWIEGFSEEIEVISLLPQLG
jgi:antitoxin (DNA-binding transcriptional repressor) of toxin-antitoxin stability system